MKTKRDRAEDDLLIESSLTLTWTLLERIQSFTTSWTRCKNPLIYTEGKSDTDLVKRLYGHNTSECGKSVRRTRSPMHEPLFFQKKRLLVQNSTAEQGGHDVLAQR